MIKKTKESNIKSTKKGATKKVSDRSMNRRESVQLSANFDNSVANKILGDTDLTVAEFQFGELNEIYVMVDCHPHSDFQYN